MSRFTDADAIHQSSNQRFTSGALTCMNFEGLIDCDTNFQLYQIAKSQTEKCKPAEIYDADAEQERKFTVIKQHPCAAVIEVE